MLIGREEIVMTVEIDMIGGIGMIGMIGMIGIGEARSRIGIGEDIGIGGVK